MSKLAILLPCYNEEVTIQSVVKDFRNVFPDADIYVFDNNSRDATARIAKDAGAIVVPSRRQGKGNVVRHMFRDVDADFYIMADGDATYPAEAAPELLKTLQQNNSDMVVGMRLQHFTGKSFRKFHRLGNRLITGTIRILFNVKIEDVLSGYRVFSKGFVKAIPMRSEGFEIETELTLQAVAKGFRIQEVPINYGERPEGSFSKLSTYSDGWVILRSIFFILKDYKPFFFFGSLAVFLACCSLLSGYAPILDFVTTGLVPHLPRAVLAAALAIMSFVSFAVGLILETVNRYHNENFLLFRKLLS